MCEDEVGSNILFIYALFLFCYVLLCSQIVRPFVGCDLYWDVLVCCVDLVLCWFSLFCWFFGELCHVC